METTNNDVAQTPQPIGADFFEKLWEESWIYIKTVVDVVREPVLILDKDLHVMAGKLGDTNGNYLLDISEVWTYTCTMNLTETTINTVFVTAFANGLKAIDSATLTVKVHIPTPEFSPSFPDQPIPSFPKTGEGTDVKMTVWGILVITLGVLTTLVVKRKKP